MRVKLKQALLDVLEAFDKDDDRNIQPQEFELLLKNPEVHEILARFNVNTRDLASLKGVLFTNRLSPARATEDSTQGPDDTTSGSATERMNVTQKLSFAEFLDVVLRLRGGNAATVTDIVELREYMRQRFDRIDRMKSSGWDGSPVGVGNTESEGFVPNGDFSPFSPLSTSAMLDPGSPSPPGPAAVQQLADFIAQQRELAEKQAQWQEEEMARQAAWERESLERQARLEREVINIRRMVDSLAGVVAPQAALEQSTNRAATPQSQQSV